MGEVEEGCGGKVLGGWRENGCRWLWMTWAASVINHSKIRTETIDTAVVRRN